MKLSMKQSNGYWRESTVRYGGKLLFGSALLGAGLLCAGNGLSGDQQARGMGREGVELYRNGQYDQAVEVFRNAAELDPTLAGIQYNLGTALARAEQYGEATETLERALTYENLKSRRDTFYNLGYSRVNQALEGGEQAGDVNQTLQALRQGLGAFREAIIADPADADAKHNFELTQKLIRELEQMLQQQGQPNPQQQQEQNEEQQSQQDRQNQQNQQNRQDQQQQQEPPKQQGGLEQKPDEQNAPQNQPPDQQQNPFEGGEQQEAIPLTPEQLDALRLLNTLESERPEQFKQLFRFQGTSRDRRPLKDW
jgi:Ca-activated chloride channel family protein